MGDRNRVGRPLRSGDDWLLGQVRPVALSDTAGSVFGGHRLHSGRALPARSGVVRAYAGDGAVAEFLHGDESLGLFANC